MGSRLGTTLTDAPKQHFRVVFPLQDLLGSSTDNVNDGATGTVVDEVDIGGYSRITGVCKADQVLTVKVYQGYTVGDLETVEDVSVPSGVTEGDGVAFDIPVVAPLCKIVINNASGSNTTDLQFAAYGRSL